MKSTFLHPLLILVMALRLDASETIPGPCRLVVVDRESGWPVPLVELRTTGNVLYVTDNAGVAAFDQSELMGQPVWLEISSPGYEVAKDGFGYRGRRITPEPGRTITIRIRRTSLARRIGRLTGGGLFGESQRFGDDRDWHESGIMGSDSVQCVPYQGGLLWLWGDSVVPGYPLGIFNSSGAISSCPSADSLVPPLKLRLAYFCDAKGRPRGIAPHPGPGPTWIFGLMSMTDGKGGIHIGGCYSRITGMVEPYETGLVVWDDAQQSFVPYRVVWRRKDGRPRPKTMPGGEGTTWQDDGGKQWFLFGSPFPTMRCAATFEAWSDPARWTALVPQRTVASAGGGQIMPQSGAIGWDAWRHRWVAVFTQLGGKPSPIGEVWYAEADHPTGPWGPAVKILSHPHYTFYNPRLHLDWTPAGKPWLFFEGTYTTLFSGNGSPTPRYDYNQILYRLDLDDPGLKLAEQQAGNRGDTPVLIDTSR